MAITKEFRCDAHGDFESGFPLCPVCKKVSRRVFLTPPGIGSVRAQNINRVLDDVLPSQNLSNYTNATGYPKPTFNSIYTNDSGYSAGWGLDSMKDLLGSKDLPLTRMNPDTGAKETVDVHQWANALPKAVSAVNGQPVGRGGMLKSRTAIERRYTG